MKIYSGHKGESFSVDKTFPSFDEDSLIEIEASGATKADFYIATICLTEWMTGF